MIHPIVDVRHLQTFFYVDNDVRKAVDDVSFTIPKGRIVCLVGESGCGKSVTALSILRLIDSPGRITGGEVLFNGEDILRMGATDINNLRGNRISIISQEPMTSLDPVLTIGKQITETILEHTLLSRKQAFNQSVALLKHVGLPRAEKLMETYPHELSGGMLQRVMIAIALSCKPELLIADEPTTALDVTIQAQVLDLLRRLRDETGMSILFITHDLGVVAEIADYVLVMYAGKVIEEASAVELFKHPKHPYTYGLLQSRPVIGRHMKRLFLIEGQVPDLSELPKGCYFNNRCRKCMEICRSRYPGYSEVVENHKAACWLYSGKGANDGTAAAQSD